MPVEPNKYDDAHLIRERAEQEDPIVQYYIVLKNEMTVGKIGPQVAHAADMFRSGWEAHKEKMNRVVKLQWGGKDLTKYKTTEQWYESSYRKVFKVGTPKDFEKIKDSDTWVFLVRDAGLTEVKAGTETVLVTWPMKRSETPKLIHKLRLMEPNHLKTEGEKWVPVEKCKNLKTGMYVTMWGSIGYPHICTREAGAWWLDGDSANAEVTHVLYQNDKPVIIPDV